jgi:hypothetical protein
MNHFASTGARWKAEQNVFYVNAVSEHTHTYIALEKQLRTDHPVTGVAEFASSALSIK